MGNVTGLGQFQNYFTFPYLAGTYAFQTYDPFNANPFLNPFLLGQNRANGNFNTGPLDQFIGRSVFGVNNVNGGSPAVPNGLGSILGSLGTPQAQSSASVSTGGESGLDLKSLIQSLIKEGGLNLTTDAKKDAKPADKPADAKPADAKAKDSKPADAKPADAKAKDAKPADKPADAKPADAKPVASTGLDDLVNQIVDKIMAKIGGGGPTQTAKATTDLPSLGSLSSFGGGGGFLGPFATGGVGGGLPLGFATSPFGGFNQMNALAGAGSGLFSGAVLQNPTAPSLALFDPVFVNSERTEQLSPIRGLILATGGFPTIA